MKRAKRWAMQEVHVERWIFIIFIVATFESVLRVPEYVEQWIRLIS